MGEVDQYGPDVKKMSGSHPSIPMSEFGTSIRHCGWIMTPFASNNEVVLSSHAFGAFGRVCTPSLAVRTI